MLCSACFSFISVLKLELVVICNIQGHNQKLEFRKLVKYEERMSHGLRAVYITRF